MYTNVKIVFLLNVLTIRRDRETIIYIILYGNLLLHHKSAMSQLHLHNNLSEKEGTRKNFYFDFYLSFPFCDIKFIKYSGRSYSYCSFCLITQFTYDYNENNTLHISQATFQCKTNLYRQDINCIYINLWQRAKLQL